jgi:Zn-finger nucleic acid-binding protein
MSQERLKCPKCGAAMELVATESGSIDRCVGCKGMWFELAEVDALKKHAATVDVGDPVKATAQNRKDRINCPTCPPNTPLIRMVDPIQPHIWYESCTICFGSFFDAGEFMDLSTRTLDDLMKRFKAKARD